MPARDRIMQVTVVASEPTGRCWRIRRLPSSGGTCCLDLFVSIRRADGTELRRIPLDLPAEQMELGCYLTVEAER